MPLILYCYYLGEFDEFASKVSCLPLDRVGPDGLAAAAEAADDDVGDGNVQDHGAERGPVAVLGDGDNGQAVEDQRHHGQAHQNYELPQLLQGEKIRKKSYRTDSHF